MPRKSFVRISDLVLSESRKKPTAVKLHTLSSKLNERVNLIEKKIKHGEEKYGQISRGSPYRSQGTNLYFFFLETFCIHIYRVVIRHRFDADPEPDSTFHFDADPDPDPDPTKFYLFWINRQILSLFTAVPVFLVSIIGVIIFNIKDSTFKLSGKSIVQLYKWLKSIWDPNQQTLDADRHPAK